MWLLLLILILLIPTALQIPLTTHNRHRRPILFRRAPNQRAKFELRADHPIDQLAVVVDGPASVVVDVAVDGLGSGLGVEGAAEVFDEWVFEHLGERQALSGVEF